MNLVVVGRAPAGTVLVAVEAKADETLGPTLAGQINDLPEGSRRRDRLDALCAAVLGRPYDESLAGLRYQLFTAAVGAAIEAAQHATRIAVLAVQVFTPSVVAPSSERERAANDRDLGTFLNVLGQSLLRRGPWLGRVCRERPGRHGSGSTARRAHRAPADVTMAGRGRDAERVSPPGVRPAALSPPARGRLRPRRAP